jgi:murein DD-endopeptidase MepM/ murein hydrolase activator NlpD
MLSKHTPNDPESKDLTVLLMRHDGGSIHQWRVPRWFLVLLVLLVLGSLGGAWWVIGRHIQYQAEMSRLQQLQNANLHAAEELSRGRAALLAVAHMDSQLRDMLKYKSRKALIKGMASVGGPSPEDQRHLAALLEQGDDQALQALKRQVDGLEGHAGAQQQSFEEIRKYVDQQRNLLSRTPMGWPVRGWISSGFGPRASPFSGSETFHAGIDIANDFGSPVRATADGVVAFSGWEGGYGKLVVLDHGNGLRTLYGHNSALKVAVGQKVRRGTVLSLMGSTGESTGPHCHYEVRLHGTPVNPVKYLQE